MAIPHTGPWVVKGEAFDSLLEKNRQGLLKRKEDLGPTTRNSELLQTQSITWNEYLELKGFQLEEQTEFKQGPLSENTITFEEYKVLKRKKDK